MARPKKLLKEEEAKDQGNETMQEQDAEKASEAPASEIKDHAKFHKFKKGNE